MILRGVIFIQVLYIASIILVFSQISLAKAVANFQSMSLTDEEMEKMCYNFSVGNEEKQEFYSPNYPNPYPNNMKCVLKISAKPGHLITIDFRDQFYLESAPNCENDKLEIRDGPYGYSRPLTTPLCGKKFPNKMTSSGNYLWLKFTSDESIERPGFRAVYRFTPVGVQRPHIDECLYYRSGPSGLIEKTHIDNSRYAYAEQYDVPIDCMWTITTDPGKMLYLNFKEYQLGSPNDCEKNYIEIYLESRMTKPPTCFCGTSAEPQKTTSNVAHIRLFTHKSAFNDTNFIIHYTAFREVKNGDMCDPSTEFNCGDQTCVDVSLKCDDEFDCKYRYDEEPSTCKKASAAGMVLTSEHMIVILVVFFALVIAMCASISISCYNKIKERQMRVREYKERRSKEASVEATIDRSIRGHSSPERALEALKRANPTSFQDDEESSDGCYVPEVDLSVFKHPNGENNIPKRPVVGAQQFPYISESFESLPGDTIVPPPVPLHRKEASQEPPMPSYRIVGGKVLANPAKSEPERAPSERSTRWPPPATYPKPGPDTKGPSEKEGLVEAKSNFLRGPLEAGAPRSAFGARAPGEIGLPKFGMARVTPDGPRGPLARGVAPEKSTPLATFKSPYEDSSYRGGYRGANRTQPEPNRFRAQATIEASDKDSSRADSVASTLSAPDVIAKR